MKKTIRLALAQVNCTVGDLGGNSRVILENIEKASGLGADILSFPELAITGYPPEDLLLKPQFVEDNINALKKIVKNVGDTTVVLGFIDTVKGNIYNAACVIRRGLIEGVYHKILLPNYGVFDEKRYFTEGAKTPTFMLGELNFGVNICEDIWREDGPAVYQARNGAKLIINISSSPYYMGKVRERELAICHVAKANNAFISYTNLVGGQDELVFDGQSMIVNNKGKILAKAKSFAEDLLITDIEIDIKKSEHSGKESVSLGFLSGIQKPDIPKIRTLSTEDISEVYGALTLGLGDYVMKNAFKEAVIGLSGGIDSSMVAALAVDALGKKNVIGVYMPTHYSSEQSEKDAEDLASNLGIQFLVIPIEQIFKLYLMALDPKFSGYSRDKTEENLQARIRGNILMALSNKFGWIVLTTGNKSEMSTGYATLYGDMAGGFAVIKDVPKTLVYKLAKYRNTIAPVIPGSVFTKAPTAELRHDQKDSDTLPKYDDLDRILKAYIEEDKRFGDIVKMGFDGSVVKSVLGMVDNSEYKRRQAPPGIKITPKAFGKDRRMPITNRYK